MASTAAFPHSRSECRTDPDGARHTYVEDVVDDGEQVLTASFDDPEIRLHILRELGTPRG